MASLLTMGISTVVIGLLPGYESIGIVAPMLLALARFGQGLGLGGEWGGAALLATGKRPGAQARPVRLLPAAGRADRLLLRQRHLPAALLAVNRSAVYGWGWRVPFIFSAVLVIIGLYVRVSLHETPVFAKVAAAKNRSKSRWVPC